MPVNNSDSSNKSIKVPRLPSLQSSLPKLPTIHGKTGSASAPGAKPVIPALAASAAQVPVLSSISDIEEGEETQAISAPSQEDIEKAIAAMRGGAAAPASDSPSPAAPSGSSPSALASGMDLALAPAPLSATSAEPSFGPSFAEPSFGPSFNQAAEGEETQAISAPSEEDIKKAVEAMKKPGKPSLPQFGSPASSPAQSGPVFAPKPSLSGSPNSALAQDALPVFDSPAPEEDGPIFGGAAAEDSDLQFEDEDADDSNEKTQMLDAASDDELDIGSEKTQISMSSMEYDPLSGKLVVESGKTSQREYILVREKTSIGRAPNNDITISDIAMSRRHVEIDKFAEGFRIRDLDSGNGTVLNGYRIRVGQLRNNDIIEIGSVRFRFEQSGGDPDELWKGDPKVEYHPNQKCGSGRSASASTSAASMNSVPSAPSAAPSAPPQMESMLERQGGGIAAPTWAGASPMTSPYMMAFGPNALKNNTVTPAWANILLIVLFVTAIGSLTFWLVASFQAGQKQELAETHNAAVEQMKKGFTKCVGEYKELRISDAMTCFNNLLDTGKSQGIIDDSNKGIFEFYQRILAQEDDISKELKAIGNRPDPTLDDLEADIRYLENVPEDSLHKDLVARRYTNVLDKYKSQLKKDARELISKNNISEARDLVRRLSLTPGSAKDVSLLNKLIAGKEGSQN